jgi:hypothetical protein
MKREKLIAYAMAAFLLTAWLAWLLAAAFVVWHLIWTTGELF